VGGVKKNKKLFEVDIERNNRLAQHCDKIETGERTTNTVVAGSGEWKSKKVTGSGTRRSVLYRISVPDHDGGRPIEVNACILITHMVYL
jgi:hypothetical protein